jgi:spore coat polysaccharide biosynthesis protein SpsF
VASAAVASAFRRKDDAAGRKEAVILQARMGSRRLPGKVLAPIAGRPILEHCVERLRASGLPVVVATTIDAADDAIEEAARHLGAMVVRGAADDVLARYLGAIDAQSLTHVVRATADNPAVDIEAPRRMLDVLCERNADYATEDGLPYGSAVEAFRACALRKAAALTNDPHDREHVTPFLQRDPRFVAIRAEPPPSLRVPALRFTVDTPDDLAFMRRLFEGLAPSALPLPLAALIDAVDRGAAGG